MEMTPCQKLKWAVVATAASFEDDSSPPYPCEDIDDLYDELEEPQDAESEVRSGEVETGLECEWSRHYESKAVAMKMPDGSWVGWTYWYGGGKHGEPSAVEWMEHAYNVNCVEEQKMMTVRKFAKEPA